MNVVEALHKEFSDVLIFLNANRQPSLSSDLDKHLKKVLIISSASYFEELIQGILIDYVSQVTHGNQKVLSFVKKNAVDMLYHKYFSWGEKNEPNKPHKNANAFFSMFGSDFRNEHEVDVKTDEKLKIAIENFLQIGHLRNYLVHRNFAAQEIENLTTEEIYTKFRSAEYFIEYLKSKLI